MKKRNILSIMLIALMIMTLVGCGSKNENKVSGSDKKDKTEVTSTIEKTDKDNKNDVVGDQSGVSGPKDEIEDETKEPETEPETNTVELMSADKSKVIQTFEIPDGYTVVNDEGNKINIIDNDDDFVRIEIFSGLNADGLASLRLINDTCDFKSTYSEFVINDNGENVVDENYVFVRKWTDAGKDLLSQLNVNESDIPETTSYYPITSKLDELFISTIYDYKHPVTGVNLRDDYATTIDYYSIYSDESTSENHAVVPIDETWTIRVELLPTTDNETKIPYPSSESRVKDILTDILQ